MAEQLFQRFILRLKLNKVKCSVVYQCALLKTLFKKHGIESEIKQGFILLAVGSETTACRHYWVATGSKNYDVATALGLKYAPELMDLLVNLVDTIPDDAKRLDTETAENRMILDENETAYERYVNDPKNFWADRPNSIKCFRV
jgi:hypothetical protein